MYEGVPAPAPLGDQGRRYPRSRSTTNFRPQNRCLHSKQGHREEPENLEREHQQRQTRRRRSQSSTHRNQRLKNDDQRRTNDCCTRSREDNIPHKRENQQQDRPTRSTSVRIQPPAKNVHPTPRLFPPTDDMLLQTDSNQTSGSNIADPHSHSLQDENATCQTNNPTNDSSLQEGMLSTNIFDCCNVQSVDEQLQTTLCTQMNLTIYPHTQSAMSSSHKSVARQPEQNIFTTSTRAVSVHLHSIACDGNCLFRARSHAVTRSQTQHDILRLYVTSYMAEEPEVAEKLRLLFAGGDRDADSHSQHVASMQESGQWEISAAVHLLNCSIVCFSKYSNKQFCLQYFPPHFIDSRQRTTQYISLWPTADHHHHHRQPWAQCPLVSDAILTIGAHRCLSRAAWLNSCRVVPHHCSMSSDNSR